MDDVDRVSPSVKPVPEGRWPVHALAEDQQPRSDQPPRHKGLPQRIDNRCPRETTAEVRFARALQCGGCDDGDRQTWPRDNERDNPGTGILPLQLPQPVITPRGNTHREKKDVSSEVSQLQAENILTYRHKLPDRQRPRRRTQRAKQPP